MQHLLHSTSIIALVIALVGCAAYKPRPLDARTELDALRGRGIDKFVVERRALGDGTITSTPVFDPSDGLSEGEVVAIALVLNPELQAKRAEAGEARAALLSAGLWPNPEIGFSARAGIDGSSGVAVEADALFELLLPYVRDARKRSAEARVDEVRAEILADEYRLVAEVREQHLEVLAAERSVALVSDALELRQRVLDVVRRQREIGEGTALEVAVAELELAEARRDHRQAQNEFEVRKRELNRLLGIPPDHAVSLTGLGEPLTFTVFEDVTDPDLDTRLLTGRPELRVKEAEYRRAEQELRQAVSEQYPRLSAGPALERELEGDESLGLGLSLELPLFNRNQGQIAERSAARNRVRAEYVALLHTLRADAVAAREAVRASRAEVDAQEQDVLPLLRRNQELFEGAFRARELNLLDWITAQQRAAASRREYLDALVRYRAAVIQLEAAVGQSLSAPTTAPSTQPANPTNS